MVIAETRNMPPAETTPADDDAKLGCTPIRIGISSCLLGEAVRYDGGHKHDRYLTGTIGKMVEFVSVCPEVEIGLGTPRPTIRLVDEAGGVRLICPDTGEDLTDRMVRFAEKRVAALEQRDLSGYILKSKSPTCGMERVKVYAKGGGPGRKDRGVYASVLIERLSDLPVEEEGRLNDPVLRENFFERVFARKRVSDFFRSRPRRWTVGDLVTFHTREKFTLFAHDPAGYRALGRVVADAKGTPRAELEATYRRMHFETMQRRSTRKKHTDVLQHLAGHLKKLASDDERQELAGEIRDYRDGLVPRIVPLTILRHLSRRYGATYVLLQHYMSQNPRELMLQNHV